MTWLDSPMLAFDLESTGVDVETDRIVTAATVAVDPVKRSSKLMDWLVDPGIEIPAEATAIHGITTEYARAEGAQPSKALVEITHKLYDAWEEGRAVVAFNAAFDLTLLDRELARHGHGGLTIGGPVIDPSIIDRAVDPYRKGKRTLADVCAHYGVTQTDAHMASGDALAAARLAWKLPRVFPEIAAMKLDELHQKQIEWREAWAMNFQEYLQRQGKYEEIDGAWPMRTAPVLQGEQS